ncbi:MAG: T9SS type A sorting domain-containing protein [Bacteroidota bacterium]|jgi:photosystem II stability/assembly factor-like uncharacterized protein
MTFFQSFSLACLLALFVVHTSNAQWIPTNGPTTEVIYSLAVGVNSAGDTILFAGAYQGGVFRSDNYGDSWVEIDGGNFLMGDTGFTNSHIHALAASPNENGGVTLFAGTEGNGIYLSANADTNWTAVNSGLTNLNVYALVADSNNIFAGTSGGVFLSTNNGVGWVPTDTELRGYYGFVVSRTSAGDTVFVKLDGNGSVLRSTDRGENWLSINCGYPGWPCNAVVNSLAVNDTIMYACTYGGIYYSLNGGSKWVNGHSIEYGSPIVLAVGGPYLFAGVDHPSIDISSVWRRPLSEMLTGVKERSIQSPGEFALDQNFPNPFNPETVISFRLSVNSMVMLKIYDVLGREITALVDEYKLPGTYTVEWVASAMSSGVYFYRLTAGNSTQSRKMLLTK